MKKKRYIIFAIMMVIFFAIITNYIDSGMVTTGHEPKFCIKIVNATENKVTYWGVGYKVIRYVNVSPNEPYENNIGVKMGNWLMQYELPIDYLHNEGKSQDINTLEDFYNTELTKNNDIRNLGKAYSTFDAQKDNCFVVGAMVHNDNLYSEFMENYEKQKNAFIRIAQNTIEGDLILYDILYDQKTDKLYLVIDNTRDEFSADEDRKIKMKQFENISEYQHENHLYWILYNGEITDENLKSENVFWITTIN